MSDPIVHVNDTVVLVGGASIKLADLNNLQNLAQCFVAADGGANHLLGAGVTPAAVIGDLDSLSEAARAAFAHLLHPVTEQDTTDFEKALSRISAPLIVGLGFLGGRIDHTLSVFNVLARRALAPVVLISDEDVCFLARPVTQLTLPVGSRIALMPLTETHVRTTGLRWDIAGRQMHPVGMISSSNAVAHVDVRIEASDSLLITLPKEALAAAIAAVRAQ